MYCCSCMCSHGNAVMPERYRQRELPPGSSHEHLHDALCKAGHQCASQSFTVLEAQIRSQLMVYQSTANIWCRLPGPCVDRRRAVRTSQPVQYYGCSPRQHTYWLMTPAQTGAVGPHRHVVSVRRSMPQQLLLEAAVLCNLLQHFVACRVLKGTAQEPKDKRSAVSAALSTFNQHEERI